MNRLGKKKKIANDKIRLAKDALKLEKDITKAAHEKVKLEKGQRLIKQERRAKLELAMATTLFDKDIDIDTIAKIMEITPKTVEKTVKK